MKEYCSGARDYIERYVEFQELKANAQAKLDMLLAEANSIVASTERSKAMELEVKIASQRTYLGRIDEIIKNWGKSLASLGQTFNKTEYVMFNTLIIRGVPPKNTKWSLQTCYNFRAKVFKAIKELEEKKEG